ncbi:hypothetical protein [Methyloceanibacter sp. wino2]|uniref:hypothetical protein n=1 Tax=Methyloceanibacter sp. wino2 TaxID=2170729 RepID=UPI000D3E15A4|nr:hypothetical protein [Methyloceanibacter sp. wino2]
MANDLGGWDTLSEAQRQLVRSCTGLTILRENLDAKSVMGEPVDVGDYTRLTGALGRTLRLLGIDRKAKDVTPPDPLSYARRRSRNADDIEEVDDESPS